VFLLLTDEGDAGKSEKEQYITARYRRLYKAI